MSHRRTASFALMKIRALDFQFGRLVLWAVVFLLIGCAGMPVLGAAYTWRNVVAGGGGYVTGLIYHPGEKDLLYARTDVGGAYRWDAVNSRWIPLNDDLTGYNNGFNLQGVLSLAIDPTDTNCVYLACGQGTAYYNVNAILRSADRGVTWTRTNVSFGIAGNSSGRGTGERLSVNPFNPLQLIMGTSIDGLWKSEDRGVTWAKLSAFAPYPPATPATPVLTNFVLHDPTSSGVVYVGIADLTGPSLWRTNDGGTSWSAVVGQPTGLMALQAKLNATGTLYVSYANTQTPSNATTGAVWKLANASTSATAGDWANLNAPAGQGGFCGLSLFVAPSSPDTILISTIDRWSPRDQIYLSTNGGTTWTGILDGATLDYSLSPWQTGQTPHWITDVEIDPYDSNHASFVTGFGVFTTHNLKVTGTKPTWTFSSTGLEETVPTGLVSPATGSQLVTTIGDFDGFRHTNVDLAPVRLSPYHGTNNRIAMAGAAPAVMVRNHSTGSISHDAGATWTDFPSAPAAVATNGAGNIALSADGARILWCPDNSVPYWSSDNGSTWTASTGTADGSAGDLIPVGDTVTASDFYVLDVGTDKLLRSTNGGVSFTTLSTVIPASAGAIASVPGLAGELWINGGGISRLTNNGTTITKSGGIKDCQVFGFGKSASTGGYPAIYLWGQDNNSVEGIYRSTDTGATWTRINDDAHRFSKIRCITGDPNTFGRFYFGTSGRGVLVGELQIVPLASSVIYEDALTTGWSSSSWATVNFAVTSPVRRGVDAISVNAAGYAAFSIKHANLDTTGYTSIAFWLHGGATGGQALQMRALRNNVNQPLLTLATSPSANTWTRYVVPLTSLGISNVPDFSGFIIQNRTGSTLPVFYVDDIALVGALDYDSWQPQTYAIWQTENFTASQLTVPVVSGTTADPDGDGQSNRIEWLLFRDPLTADPGSWADLSLFTDTNNALFYDVTFDCRVVTGTDAPIVETSSDLQIWTTLTAGGSTNTWTDSLDMAGSMQRVHWRVPVLGNPRWFIRMR